MTTEVIASIIFVFLSVGGQACITILKYRRQIVSLMAENASQKIKLEFLPQSQDNLSSESLPEEFDRLQSLAAEKVDEAYNELVRARENLLIKHGKKSFKRDWWCNERAHFEMSLAKLIALQEASHTFITGSVYDHRISGCDADFIEGKIETLSSPN